MSILNTCAFVKAFIPKTGKNHYGLISPTPNKF